MYLYWDSTYILVIIGAIICMIASAKVKTTFNKYSQYRSMSGMTGAQAAQRILNAAGIYDVEVRHVSGSLTDHYNPSNKTLNLSDTVCNSTSVAAVGVGDRLTELLEEKVTYYHTPYGSLLIGIDAYRVDIAEEEDEIVVEVEYELEINNEHVADCHIRLKANPQRSTEFHIL